MSDKHWDEVKNVLGEDSFVLGPYFANQLLNTPRHLLFTLSRYKFASKLLPVGKKIRVLELGCQEGLGTLMLAENGHDILAVDFDEIAIRHAKKSIDKPNISVIHDNFLGQKYGSFESVICLDVIEHIPQKKENTFFVTVLKNLDKNGILILGTPNKTADKYASKYSRIGHINLYNAERLNTIVSKYFNNVFIFGMNDEVLHTGFHPMCHYLFALGCCPRE